MENKKKTKAEILATYIVQNNHFCPLDDDCNVKDCAGWHNEECVKCILKHIDAIYIHPYFDI